MKITLVLASLAAASLLTGCAAAPSGNAGAKAANSGTASQARHTASAPNVVGLPLDKAHQAFEALGIKEFNDKDAFENRTALVDSNWAVLGQDPAAGTTVDTNTKITLKIGKIGEDRTTARLPEGSPILAKIRADAATATATQTATATATQTATATATATAEAYAYQGPQYTVVTVDENVSNARLNQYWVLTSKFDYSTDAYEDQVKMIIADIAHKHKTPKLIVQVVTDREIIEAESYSTIADYMDTHGADYLKNVLAPKEKSDWIAWYQGGFDADTAQPSDSDAAFEIDWFLTPNTEQWRPEIAG